MKVLLVNDTGVKAHIGCQAVSDAHARMLGRLGHKVAARIFVNEMPGGPWERFSEAVAAVERDRRFLSALDGVEAVIVNGEGTIHHGGGLALVAALEVARRKGRATLLVNALLQDAPVEADVLNGFDRVSVRDARSAAYARWRGIACVETFDSIVAAKFAATGDDLDGRIAVLDWTKVSERSAGEPSTRLMLSQDLGPRTTPFPLHFPEAVERWRGAAASLATSRLVVSSRHHGAYLAALAGAPFVAVRGGTWKGEGFLEALGGDLPVVESYFDLRAAIERIDQWRPVFAAAHERLKAAADLQHFAMLGRGEDSTEEEEVARLARDVASRVDLLGLDAERIRSRRRREAGWREALGAPRKPKSRVARWFGR